MSLLVLPKTIGSTQAGSLDVMFVTVTDHQGGQTLSEIIKCSDRSES